MIFNREFPLGVEERLVQDRWAFAIENSGLHVVRHKGNALVTMAVYLAMLGVALAAIGFLAYKMSQDGTWTIADTMEDVTDPANAQKIVDRTKARRAQFSQLFWRAILAQFADALLSTARRRAARWRRSSTR